MEAGRRQQQQQQRICPQYTTELFSYEAHMAYGCKVAVWRADRNGIFHVPDFTSLPETILVVNRGWFSDLVEIRRMGIPFRLSKTIVLQFQSIDGTNVFVLNREALLCSLPPSKARTGRGSATTWRPTPFQSQTTPSDETSICPVAAIPWQIEWEEEGLLSMGGHGQRRQGRPRKRVEM